MDHHASADSCRPAAAFARVFSSPSKAFLVFAGYFFIQCVIRVLVSPTTDLDESEQLLTTQRLAWGYGAQPPLYTWLQYPLIKILGPSVLPLALLKNFLLFCVYLLTYLNARLLTRNHWLAVLAAVSLLLVPAVAWECQRDLTHTVLVTVFAAAAFHALIQLRINPATRWYLALGLCGGLGVLSKYSFVVFLAGLIVAAWCERSWRPVLTDRRIWLALGVCLVVLLPHFAWAFWHKKAALSAVGELRAGASAPWLSVITVGFKNLLWSVLPHSAALLAAYAVVCRRKSDNAGGQASDAGGSRLILLALAVMGGLLLAGIFGFRASDFKSRWFTPLFIWLPILLVLKAGPRLDGRRVSWLLGMGTVSALAVALSIPGRVYLAELLNRPRELNVPFEQLAAALPEHERPKIIYAQNNWIGGNLKRCFPDAFVFSPQLFLDTNFGAGTRCLVVWDAMNRKDPEGRAAGFMFASLQVDAASIQPRFVSAPLRSFRTREARLGYAVATIPAR